jgi:elongation factor G
MKKYSAQSIRNICLLSHGGVGKTSLAEAMCFASGGTTKQGNTSIGTSIFDTRPDEKDRKVTISMTAGFAEWKDTKINFLDCPGFLDFLGDVRAAVRVTESAIVLVDATDGIQVGTEVNYRILGDSKLPHMFFINGMDKEMANFEKTLAALKETFGSVAPIVIPLGTGAKFTGVIDIVSGEAWEYSRAGNGAGKKVPIPADLNDEITEIKAALMESVAESDEELMTKFFDAGVLTDEEIRNGLAKGVAAGTIHPVLCGSALQNMGVDVLMNKITALCPSAASRKTVEALSNGKPFAVDCLESKPASGICFKTISEEHLGEVNLVRVFSGKMATGQELYNPGRNNSERLGMVYVARGHDRLEANEVLAGDICALLKLKDTHTGDTLADKTLNIQFPKIDFPTPLVRVAISAKSKDDEDKVGMGFVRLHEEDPTFTFLFEGDIRQSILSCMGDVHVEVILNNLKSRYKVDVERKTPKISYRETITKSIKYVEYSHKKQTGGAGQYAKVAIDVEPKKRGEGYEFADKIVGGVIDQSFRPSVDKGIRSRLPDGFLAGYPIVDVKVSLVDGKTHPVDSKDIAFQVAGREAFKIAFEQCAPILLEPIVDLKVTVPDQYMGDVMGDLSSRRGRISGMEPEGRMQAVKAKVPEAEIQTYAQTLRSITQGRGFFSKTFSHYDPVPPEVAKKIIEAASKPQEVAAEE